MIYYIDGYNLLFSYFKELEKADPLNSDSLNRFTDRICKLGLNAVLVFDAYNSPKQVSRFDFREIEVVFTALNQKADDYFLEMLNHSKAINQVTFVSNDKALCRSLVELGGHTLSLGCFFKLVNKREMKKQRAEDEKQWGSQMSRDYHYYYKAFTKKNKK